MEPPGRVQKGPYVFRCEANKKYAYCVCQKSATYPLCDGSHRGSGINPIKVIPDQERSMVWCACGQSKNMPACDGSHSCLP